MANKQTNQDVAEKQLKKLIQSTKAQLEAMPKVKLLIPRDPLNPKDTHAIVSVNGHIYRIQRGVQVEVPQVIAEIWHESYNKTIEAQNRIQVQEDVTMLA